MKKLFTLFSLILTVLSSSAQEQWNAVKVLDFNPYDQEVMDMRIDTVGVADGEFVFSFLTSYGTFPLRQKIISTDSNGNVIKATDYPYQLSYYTVMENGDTLIAGDGVINVTKNVTISYLNYCYHITSTSSGIYVNFWDGKRGGRYLMNIVNQKKICDSGTQCPMCRRGDGIYMIIGGDLCYYDEKTNEITKTKHNVQNPVGIAEYRGSLYVYSLTDKSVYRLELTSETAVGSFVEIDGMKEAVHYGLDGRITDPSTPGVHIIRLPDGTVSKTIVTRQ